MRRPRLGAIVAGRSRTMANIGALSIASTAIVVAAATSDGYKATNVDLDDGAVWVTDASENRLGRLVVEIDQVDVVRVVGDQPDVIQDGRRVIAGDAAGTRLIQVETAQESSRLSAAPLATIRSGGGFMVVHDRETGKLWTGTDTGLLAADFPDGAVGTVEPGAYVELTAAGRLVVIDPSVPDWYEIELDPSGTPVMPVDETLESSTVEATTTTLAPPADGEVEEELPELVPEVRTPIPGELPAELTTTRLGDEVFLLTSEGEVVGLDGRRTDVPGSGWRLQQRGPDAGPVHVATDDGLFAVVPGDVATPVFDGQPGMPAAPAAVGPCVFAAWASTSDAAPKAGVRCGDETPQDGPIENAVAGRPLEWRVNGLNVALNSIKDGRVWAVHDGRLVDIGDWGDERGEESDVDSPDETASVDERADERCDRGGDNLPPEAEPDELGARAGGQTLLDVLANDSDGNCDPISIAADLEYDASVGSFAVVDNGQRILFTPVIGLATDGPVRTELSYSAIDVAGEPSATRATVALQISPQPTEDARNNSAPAVRRDGDGEERPQLVAVEQGERITFDALADWFDPDGDEITLTGVTLPSGAGEVTFSPLGRVQYSVPNVRPGTYDLEIVVSDGRTRSIGTVEATVLAENTEADPEASNDFATVAVGGRVVVHPLANDGDPNGAEDLSSAIFPDLSAFRAQGLDVHYDNLRDELVITALDGTDGGVVPSGIIGIPYTLTDLSGRAAEAIVQVSVLTATGENSAPVAVPDRTIIRPGRLVDVDVLANDVDVDGDLLAIVGVQAQEVSPERGGVRAAVVDRRFLQVELVRPSSGAEMSGFFVVEYAATDGAPGRAPVPGQLVVVVDASTNDQPPTAFDDVVAVRQGEVARLDVLANDVDPDGDQIELVGLNASSLGQRVAANELFAWVDDGDVYVRGGTPGANFELLYDIEANGRQASGRIRVTVTEAPTQNPNLPPEPPLIEVRAARGATVRIPVPLDGIDPDGDRIVLSSVLATANPTETSASLSDEPGVIVYQSSTNGAATEDRFTYELQDTGPGGGTIAGEVRVLIVDVDFSAPVAHDDVLRARPGTALVVPVLANDVDADDDELVLSDPPFVDVDGVPTATPVSGDVVAARADASNEVLRGGYLEVKAPASGTLTERYRITDGRFESSASVQVIVDPTAPNAAPVTAGVDVTKAELTGLAVGAPFVVDVASVTFDPDASPGPLTYGVPGGQPGVTAEATGGTVVVPLTADAQTIVYSVRDGDPDDPATSHGVIRVPGVATNSPPERIDGERVWELRVEDARPLTFTLDQLVTDPDGDPVELTGADVTAPPPLSVQRTGDDSGFEVAITGEVLAQQVLTVTFEVQDLPVSGLPSISRTFQLSVLVVPEDVNNPPRLVTNGSISVPLVDEPQQIDLANLVEDDEGDDIRFELTGQPTSVDVELRDTVLVVTGNAATSLLGPAGPITFRFNDDEKDHTSLEGNVQVTITQTNKAAPTAVPLGTFDALTDRPAAPVDVIAAASNPAGFELEIVSVTVIGTGGTVTCSTNCGTAPVVFTPRDPGEYTVQYTISEKIAQPRQSTSTITYVAKGEPLAPGTPSIVSVGDERVSLSWTAADMRGGTFVEYVVRVVGSNQTQTTTSTSLEFGGLKNDTTYQFEVYAVNEIGDGLVSGPSSNARPDRVPDPPVAPRFTSYENAALNLAWDPPATASSSRYSPIIEYQVELAGFGTFTVGADTTTFRQAGLTNGTNYTFRVRARNSADVDGGWGAWSVASAPEKPSTNPAQVTGVTVTPSGDGGQSRATVTWTAPNDGGRAILHYVVCSVPATLGCVQADLTRRQEFDVPTGSPFTFTVRAVNSDVNTPEGPNSAPSASFTGIIIPGAPSNLQVTAADGRLTATATAGSNGGCTTSTVEYSINGTSYQLSGSFTGLANGNPYTVYARMRIGAACQQFLTAAQKAAPWSAAIQATGKPLGPLVQPSVSGSPNGESITFNWSAAQGSNGRTWSGQVLGGVCDQSFGAGNPTGSCSVTVGYNASRTITVRVTDTADGGGSVERSFPVSTGPPPPPFINTSNSGVIAPPAGSCGLNECTYVNVSGGNFPANTALQVNCEGDSRWFNLTSTNGSGSFGPFTSTCRHSGSASQVITVRVSGGGASASQVSDW